MPSAGGAPEIIAIRSSAAFLPEASALKRQPRAPRRKRPQTFWDTFEDRALVYDCFWSADGKDIVLSCPPPLNLAAHWDTARFVAQPSGTLLVARRYVSRSTMTVSLAGAPSDTTAIVLDFAGETFVMQVQPNLAEKLAGRRVMFTMNKDNDLDWIRLWADWHARLHGIDAIVVFDNGSTRYAIAELENALAEIPGLAKIAVLSWPYRYGPVDPAVLFHPYWANFLQVASFRVTVSRLTPKAAGLLNCDIDELVGLGSDGDVFSSLEKSPDGLVVLKGTWVEAATASQDAAQPHHLRYRYRNKNSIKAICANKWLIDPTRPWARDFNYTPMMHRIYGLSRATNRRAPKGAFFHFKAINTNWKETRNMAKNGAVASHTRLLAFDAQVERYRAESGKV